MLRYIHKSRNIKFKYHKKIFRYMHNNAHTHTHTQWGIKGVKMTSAPLENVLLIIYIENKTANNITIKSQNNPLKRNSAIIRVR